MKIFVQKKELILVFIILLSVFLRFYRLNDLMIFGGDVARDYLEARDITLGGKLPLIGSPSSVTWLYQGAFFTYLLAVVLWVGKYNPLAGGYFVGVLGVLGVLGVYVLAKKFFSQEAGLLAAFFYATSPLIIIFDRYPYHQSLISLMVIVFFLSLLLATGENGKYFILSSFIFGLLMQLELSNLVLFPILALIFIDFRHKISLKVLLLSFLVFVFTWTPKIIFDFNHGFTQTIGFLAWIVHKVTPLYLLVGDVGVGLPTGFLERIEIIIKYLTRIIFWPNRGISMIFFLILVIGGFYSFKFKERKKDIFRYLLLLWLIIPFLGFLVQGSPSGAYIPAIFGLPALLLGLFYEKYRNLRIFLISFIVLTGTINAVFLIKNEYFMLTGEKSENAGTYNMGQSYEISKKMAKYIVSDADGRSYNLITLGSYSYFASAKLDLIYLAWYFGNQPNGKKENLIYYVFKKDDNIVSKSSWKIQKFPYLVLAKETKE